MSTFRIPRINTAIPEIGRRYFLQARRGLRPFGYRNIHRHRDGAGHGARAEERAMSLPRPAVPDEQTMRRQEPGSRTRRA